MEITAFVSSFIILLREGFEAMLIAMLVFMYLDKVKARHKRPAVFWGMGVGVLVSLLIALGFKKIVGLTGAHEELFEGGVMLIAAGMLTYVAFFCHAAKKDLENKVDQAITSGKTFVLSFTVFLAIVREGFEIVLFYAALFSAGVYNTVPAIIGGISGLVALVIIYFGMGRITKIIPIGSFFRVSSVMLFLVAIYFAYEGVHEIREGLEAFEEVVILDTQSTIRS
jgi:high-affinity iron transporter